MQPSFGPNMAPVYGQPYGALMPVDHRYYGGLQPQPVGPLSVAAIVMVGVVALIDLVQAVAGIGGHKSLEVLLGILHLLALLTAAVVFVVWLWRVRTNVEAIAGVQTQRLGKGWGIGGWITPIVTFWYPYQYVVDISRASAPNRHRSRDGIVLAWWLTYLAARMFTQFTVFANTPIQAGVVVGDALEIAAGVLAVLVIRRISDRQSAAMRIS